MFSHEDVNLARHSQRGFLLLSFTTKSISLNCSSSKGCKVAEFFHLTPFSKLCGAGSDNMEYNRNKSHFF